MITATNYTAKAIPDLLKARDFYVHLKCDQAARLTDFVIARLKDSVKFIVPENGLLYDGDKYTQSNADLLYAPYKSTAIEYYSYLQPTFGEYSSRQITLLVETDPDDEYFRREISPLFVDLGGGVNVTGKGFILFSISYIDKGNSWELFPAALFTEYDQILQPHRERPDREGFYSMIMLLDFENNELGNLVLQRLLSDGNGDITTAITKNISPEFNVAVQMCTILNCNNIETRTIKPSEKLNKKRIKNGRIPYDEYKVLCVKEKKQRASDVNISDNRLHRSPRTHLRRGHIRRLADKVTWVSSSVVNAGSGGSIIKDYSVARNG